MVSATAKRNIKCFAGQAVEGIYHKRILLSAGHPMGGLLCWRRKNNEFITSAATGSMIYYRSRYASLLVSSRLPGSKLELHRPALARRAVATKPLRHGCSSGAYAHLLSASRMTRSTTDSGA